MIKACRNGVCEKEAAIKGVGPFLTWSIARISALDQYLVKWWRCRHSVLSRLLVFWHCSQMSDGWWSLVRIIRFISLWFLHYFWAMMSHWHWLWMTITPLRDGKENRKYSAGWSALSCYVGLRLFIQSRTMLSSDTLISKIESIEPGRLPVRDYHNKVRYLLILISDDSDFDRTKQQFLRPRQLDGFTDRDMCVWRVPRASVASIWFSYRSIGLYDLDSVPKSMCNKRDKGGDQPIPVISLSD